MDDAAIIFLYTATHTHIHTYIHTYILSMEIATIHCCYAWAEDGMCCEYACVCVYVYVRVHMHVLVVNGMCPEYVCVYVYVRVYACIGDGLSVS